MVTEKIALENAWIRIGEITFKVIRNGAMRYAIYISILLLILQVSSGMCL